MTAQRGLPFLCLLLLPSLVAQDRPQPYPIREPAVWRAAVEEGTRTPEGRPGPSHWTNRARYSITAELMPEEALLRGHVEVTYQNRSPEPLRELKVHLRQNLHRDDAVRNTRVEITGGMRVTNVTVAGEPLEQRRQQIRGTVMTVRLPQSIESGGQTTLAMDWEFTVPRAGHAPRMGHEGNHVFFLGYWYPQVAVYDDLEGWVAEQYLGNGEFYMGYADYEVAFTAPRNWLVRATGQLQNADEVLTDSALAALQQARSAAEVVHVITAGDLEAGTVTRATAGGKVTWRFAAENVRDCAVSVSDRYLWDATHAVIPDRDGPGRDGTCMIHAVYEEDARTWERAAAYARHTIEFVSKTLYPYPWPQMTACEGVVGGGMEYPMMTIVGDMPVPFALQAVVAHELIHMWFPMIVGSNEKAHAWLDEGLTSFVTDLVTADFWKGEGMGSSIREYVMVAPMWDSPMMTHGDYYPPGPGYGIASYSKPAAVLHQLAGMVGDEAVLQGLREYIAAWAYRHPTPYDLFALINDHLQQDLDWYWRTWCFETWLLDHAVADVESGPGGSVVTIEDLGDAPHPAVVRVVLDDGSEVTRTIDVQHWLQGSRTATLQFDSEVVEVHIDPEQLSLDVDRRNNSWKRK